MFGRTRELNDTAPFDGPSSDDFFGDEVAAEEAAHIDALRDRVVQVESRINSQFTSLATYAQIAQEQIELARAEAKASTERSEHRLTDLIERERADRIRTLGSHDVSLLNVPLSSPDVDARLDALERSVEQIKVTLDECFTQQKALADAINRMFEVRAFEAASTVPAPTPPAAVSPPAPAPKTFMPPTAKLPAPDPAGPIAGLSLNLRFD